MYRETPRRQHRERSGFTITEVVTVLVVIGVLAAITLPKIDLARYQAETAMQGVGTTLLAAQRLAVTRQHDVIVKLDAAGHALVIHEDGNNDRTVESGERERRVSLGDQVVFGRGSAPPHPLSGDVMAFTKRVVGMPAVTFHRNGSASEAGGFYLTTRREAAYGGHSDDTRLIWVDRATGRTSWYRHLDSGWRRGF
jgi:prepilin-type N-terminal cleavage/methylation domain-containing protein